MKINKGQKHAITGTFFGEDSHAKNGNLFLGSPSNKNKADSMP